MFNVGFFNVHEMSLRALLPIRRAERRRIFQGILKYFAFKLDPFATSTAARRIVVAQSRHTSRIQYTHNIFCFNVFRPFVAVAGNGDTIYCQNTQAFINPCSFLCSIFRRILQDVV